MRRLIDDEPTEMVFLVSATELAPNATEFAALALAELPIAMALA
jgi:hypothetical protein